MKNRFFSDFRFFTGLDFITIEISVLILLSIPVLVVFWFIKEWKTDFHRTSGFLPSCFIYHWNQRTQFAIHTGFGPVLIYKSMKNRFSSDFRFFTGLALFTIEISVLSLLSIPVLVVFWFIKVWKTDFSRTSGFFSVLILWPLKSA